MISPTKGNFFPNLFLLCPLKVQTNQITISDGNRKYDAFDHMLL